MQKTAPALLAILAVSTIGYAQQATEAPRQKQERAGQQAGQAQQAQPGRAQQQQGQNQPIRREAGFRGEASANSIDSHVADCLMLKNQEELALLKMGAERAESKEVKEFAQKLIQDHEKSAKDLAKFASQQHAQIQLQAGRESRDGEARVATREARKPAAEERAAGSESSMAERMFQIQHRAAQECLALTEKELSKHEGAKFDQAFLGQQIGAHIGMLAHLKALDGEVSPELQKVVEHCEQATQEHMEQAEKLMAQLSHSDQEGQRGQREQRNQQQERRNTESRNE